MNLEEAYTNDDNNEYLLSTYSLPCIVNCHNSEVVTQIPVLKMSKPRKALKCPVTCLKSCSHAYLGPKLLITFALNLYKPFHFDLCVLQQPFENGRLFPFYIERGK